MAHTFTQSIPNVWHFSSNGIALILNGNTSSVHAALILILADEAKRWRLEQLLNNNSNFAYVWFLTENGISVPPDPEPMPDVEEIL